ncbi:MAG: hypothetical protein IT269_05990 [Saprospiraceae bacterium]|nr:hypothetical protein [Saprospiraceae bacterium]
MHDIEPHFKWRDDYIASEDPDSPFYGYENSEVSFTHRLYNFYIHPQWDSFGSTTLYGKLLWVDYDEGFALVELIGEWNDALHNDIMYLKRHVAEPLMEKGIYRFAFFCENVLNFHTSMDDDYYAEWAEEVNSEGGWIVLANVRQHLIEEMDAARLWQYLNYGEHFNDLFWQKHKPPFVCAMINALVDGRILPLQP